MDVLGGIMWHAAGASSAAVCYTPQKKVANWSWQTFWLAQAAVCWLILPVVAAAITIPQLGEVLRHSPSSAMVKSFVLGMAYGIGGTAFGLAIRYVGFSLTYAMAVGISCVLGTLLPPLVAGNLSTVFQQQGAGYIITGIILGAVGIACCGLAGRSKEMDQQSSDDANTFSLAKGLPLCFLAGILSAVYGFSLDQGQPIADVAARYGSGQFQINAVYIFSNSGAFLTTMLYCLFLHKKHGTMGEYAKATAAGTTRLSTNYLLASLTGLLWFGQFFFYGMGHTRMGTYKFSSWAIHMIMLVLFSSITGLVLKEWTHCQPKTRRLLLLALIILVSAVVSLGYGNYLGNP